jgi:hypothetical protein
VMAQSPQVQPLLCIARKANTADADLEMRGGAAVKVSETSLAAAAPPGQRRSSAALSSSLHPQLFHTIDPPSSTLLEPATCTSCCSLQMQGRGQLQSHSAKCVREEGWMKGGASVQALDSAVNARRVHASLGNGGMACY